MVTVLMRDQLWIPPCSVFHGWMRQSLVSLPAAKRQGARTLVENAGRHPGHFHKAPWEECQRFKIKPSQHSPLLPTELIRRMEREYEICDRIVVPSNLARSSLAEFGLADKTSVVFPGVDEQFFFPAAAAGGTATAEELVPRLFCCSPRSVQGGRLSAASVEKARLGQCRTAAGGEVRPEMKELLETHAGSGVRAAGFLTIEKLVELYRESDLFVFPSVNEGLAQVLLEAMAAGSPVVSTELSGARDCVTEGKEGFIVPARDVDRTAQAIQWCCDHRDETRAMGRAARARIEKQFTLDHYNQPMIALYRGLAGTAD